jgi:capsular polysaccharide biosynthesis protein
MNLEITRRGTQKTQEFRYDDYYRLQADQMFADTIVEWLKSPDVISEITKQSGANIGGLSAVRRSSQLVAVNFSVFSEQEAQDVASATSAVISQKTDKLNAEQNEENWFRVISGNPSVSKYVPNYEKIMAAAVLAGLFIGFWLAMIRHYFN